tara:strand:- start:41 stop:1315 length:1275 start_codon:yes stop_codon:yes gene_type:complete
MSYIGGPLPGQEKTEEEQKESLNKALSTGKKIAGALIPDLTDPRETAEYFTDLVSDIKLTRSPIKGAGVFAGKRLMADLPVIRRAVDAGQEIAKPIIKKTQDFLNKDYFEPVYASIGVQPRNLLSEGVEAGLTNKPLQYSNINEVPANVRTRRAAKIHFGNTKFIDEFSAKTKQLQDHFAKHGNLDNVDASVRKITAPNGEQYVWKGTAPKGQKGVYSWKAVSNIKEVTRSRRAAQALDTDTLKPLFKKIADIEDGIDPILEYSKYQRTNKKVVQKVQDAINLANKLPDGTKKPKSEWLSLEHIFDVNFYTRTKKDLVTSFAGKGADELDNLKVIPYTLNSLTGAENKKITIADALVKAVRRGEFTDYDKSVSQFIYNNIGDAVNKFTNKDWKNFTDRVLKGEDGVTIQDILFDITSKNNYGIN